MKVQKVMKFNWLVVAFKIHPLLTKVQSVINHQRQKNQAFLIFSTKEKVIELLQMNQLKEKLK